MMTQTLGPSRDVRSPSMASTSSIAANSPATKDEEFDVEVEPGPRPRAPLRAWQPHEDDLLRAAVAQHGPERDKWPLIAAHVPGRDNKACRKRWLLSLDPKLKKTAWTKEEDELLVNLHQKYPCKWALIAKQISGRTDDACAKRYRDALDPANKQGEWTPEEDRRLMLEYKRWGGRWASVAVQLGRSGLGCRNRWRMLERRKANDQKRNSRSASPPRSSLPTSSARDEGPYSPVIGRHPEIPVASTSRSNHDVAYQEQPQQLQNQELFEPSSRFNPDLFNSRASNTSSLPGFDGDIFDMDIPIDPALADLFAGLDSGQLNTNSFPLEFDPRVWDIMSGGCGCGCGSPGSTGCTCSSGTAPPFMDIPMQDFLNPFHQMQQIYRANQAPAQTDPGVTHASQAAFPQAPSQLEGPLQSISMDSALVSQLPQQNPLASGSCCGSKSSADPATIFSSSTAPPSTNEAKWAAALSMARARDVGVMNILQEYQHAPKNCKCSGPCCISQLISSTSLEGPGRPSNSMMGILHYQDESTSSDRKPKLAGRTSQRDPAPPRLSSQLATDAQLRPYACGFPSCWVSDDVIRVRFNTSGELLQHHRDEHGEDGSGSDTVADGKLFRCALDRCGKGWKSINGIQYHLQISKAHFSKLVNKTLMESSEVSVNPDLESGQSGCCCNSSNDREDEDAVSGNTPTVDSKEVAPDIRTAKLLKKHPCPHPGCPNVYKQAAGLRYHLKHGHPSTLPTQLDTLPPALAEITRRRAQLGS